MYPEFNYDSIRRRMEQDMCKFNKLYDNKLYDDDCNFNNFDYVYHLYDLTQHLSKTKECYTNMKDKINSILANMSDIINKKGFDSIDSFDYSHDIIKFETEDQYTLWRLRTTLFYQMLVFVSALLTNQTLFELVYNESTIVNKPLFKRIVLSDFKCGIFGSLTPSSDIDLGVQCSKIFDYTKYKYDNGLTPLDGLSYIVSIIEDMYMIFYGFPSLQLDIEVYADMITIPGVDKSIFYLNTDDLVKSDLSELLPSAYASIIRNFLLANKKATSEDIQNAFFEYIKQPGTQHQRKRSKMDDMIDAVGIIKRTNFNQVFDEEYKTISEYLQMPYDEAREVYYAKVTDAAQFIRLKLYSPEYKQTKTLSKKDRIEIIRLIGIALKYRMESYICVPTIYHVVRVLQAESSSNKYDVTWPLPECSQSETKDSHAVCDIGEVGYLLSMLEQIGYLMRFEEQYKDVTKDTPDYNKYQKKIKKYDDRYRDAFGRYQKIYVYENVTRRRPSNGTQRPTQRPELNDIKVNKSFRIPKSSSSKNIFVGGKRKNKYTRKRINTRRRPRVKK